MHSLIELWKNSDYLHHAYLYVGHKLDEMVSDLKHFLADFVGIETTSNPDFWHGKFQTFTIENARQLTEGESRKSISNGRKIFIIETDFITEEAQNALLKAFEEPTPNTHFFVLTPQDALLPTLRSRMQVIFHESAETTPSSILKLNPKERLEKVKEIIEAIKDEEGTKQDAIALLNGIEKELHNLGTEKSAKALKVCESARASLYDRGAPVKMILENLMLSI